MKTLILDFGNVVAFFDHRRASRRLASLGTNQVTEEAIFQAVFGTSLESDFDCGKIVSTEFIHRLRTVCQLTSSDEVIVAAWCDIFWPNESMISLLPHLKKATARLLLASNTNELHFQWVTRQFAESLAFFDGFILSYRVGSRKPALVFYQECAKAAETAPSNCIFVDDRPDFVEGARAVGMTSFLYHPDLDLAHALQVEGVEIV